MQIMSYPLRPNETRYSRNSVQFFSRMKFTHVFHWSHIDGDGEMLSASRVIVIVTMRIRFSLGWRCLTGRKTLNSLWFWWCSLHVGRSQNTFAHRLRSLFRLYCVVKLFICHFIRDRFMHSTAHPYQSLFSIFFLYFGRSASQEKTKRNYFPLSIEKHVLSFLSCIRYCITAKVAATKFTFFILNFQFLPFRQWQYEWMDMRDLRRTYNVHSCCHAFIHSGDDLLRSFSQLCYCLFVWSVYTHNHICISKRLAFKYSSSSSSSFLGFPISFGHVRTWGTHTHPLVSLSIDCVQYLLFDFANIYCSIPFQFTIWR